MDTDDSRPRGDGKGVKHEEEIVIAGGGIGGLACALTLHRVGLKAVVLERAGTLPIGGTAIALSSNAFKVLDVLGIGQKFRTWFTNLLAWEVLNARGKSLAKVVFADCEGGKGRLPRTPHDLRAVERKVLLEVLAGELPEGTIRFNSRVTGIKNSESRPGFTEVVLQDGSIYTAKVVIGCDGINSCVASWMGLPKPQPVGQVVIRGMAIFPDGHQFEDEVQFFYGKGMRTAYLPASATKVYWFLVWNDSSQGWRDVSQEQQKKEALRMAEKAFLVTSMPLIINHTPPQHVSKTIIRHRVNENPESLVASGVTVAGDAAHPTTPSMGQGGALALEDAVVLTQKLYAALKPTTTTTTADEGPTTVTEPERIHQALLEFQVARHERTRSITSRSYQIGSLMKTGWTIVDIFRDWVVIPRVVNKNTFLAHTLFDVGKLPGQ